MYRPYDLFFPLVAIHLPIVGDKGISGYDAVSKIFTFTKDLTPDLSSSGSTGSATTSVRLPLSLQLVWLIPALILVALACALGWYSNTEPALASSIVLPIVLLAVAVIVVGFSRQKI